MDSIAKALSDGFPWMHFILIVSIIAVGIIIERFIFIFFKYSINGNTFMGEIQKLVVGNQVDKAIKICNAAPNAALARVIKAGLTRANKSPDEIQSAVEEATLEVLPHVQKRVNSLQALANIATLLGLLGTIIGMIGAFDVLANTPAAQKQAKLATEISLAMYTTAFGLIVAIPCMLAHMVISGKVKSIIDDIDYHSVRLENLLVARGKGE